MTAAVASTNALANPLVWQQFQQAAAQAAAAAYLAESTSNQQTLPSSGLSGTSSNLTGQATLPVTGQITIAGTEAVGRGGPHTVEFAADLNTMTAVNVMMADGEQLQSHLLGLSYNTADGRGVMIAGMKDSVGELLPPNRIIYRNVFDGGIDGDVVYTYTAYSVEQDVVLHQQLPSPALYQFNPAQARLGVVTEFLQPPEPLQAPVSVDLSVFKKQQGVQGPSTMPDEQIQFKTMRLVQGRAFSLGNSTAVIPSGKRWLQIASRHFLIESTPYPLIESLLNTLPPLTAQLTTHRAESIRAMLLNAPEPSLVKKHQQIRLARSDVKAPGVVLDYLMISSPLLDINFGAADTNKVGFAAIGQTTNDYWNGYQFWGQTSANVYDLEWVDRNRSGINLNVQNAPGVWGNNTGDGMYDLFIYPWNGGNVTATLSDVPAGSYDFYLYGHSGNADENSKFQITVGGNTTAWEQTQDSTFAATSTNWTEGAQYVVFRNVTISSGQSAVITCATGDGGSAVFNGLQMVSDVTGQPVILAQPASQCVFLGGNATLAVTASGTTPLSYQWQLNGINIPGATTATLPLSNVQFADGGSYTVTVNNSLGSVTSAPAVLRVLTAYSALLNVNFTGATQNKIGFAAIGLSTNDIWNEYREQGGVSGAVTMTNLQWSDGITSPVSSIGMTVSNAPGIWANNTGDNMYDPFIYPWNGGDVFVTLTNLPANTYDFYLYGHTGNAWENSKFQITVGTNTTAWEQTQDSTFAATSTNWVEGVQYVVFRDVTVANNQPVSIVCAPGDYGSAVFNGMQILLPMPSAQTDREGDGLPDDWEIEWFGRLGVGADTLDGNGNTMLSDYLAGSNPSDIGFTARMGNQHFNTAAASGSYLILGGVPSYEAVLVNDDNFDDATWQSYDGIVHLNLGPTDGVYQVWLGLKGFATNSQPAWFETTVYLDRVPPQLFLTSPTNSVTAVPILQIEGWSPDELSGVSFDLSNAVVVLTNQSGYLTGSWLDINSGIYTTNNFQCFDIPLTNGLNAITLRVTDLAGNVTTTNLNLTLNYSSATNPVVELTWPTNGMEICQSSFTLRGWTDDSSAQVTAQIVDASGNTNTIYGMVERNGKLWAENIPLASGTNALTLTVVNSAGLSSATNLMLVKSDMVLTLDSINGDLWLRTVNVSGRISDTTATIWVNGVQGTNNGDGTWSATNVPVTPGGVASFDLNAVPAGGDDPYASVNQNKNTGVVMDSAKGNYDTWWDALTLHNSSDWKWSRQSGGYKHTRFEAGTGNDMSWDQSDDTIASNLTILNTHITGSDGTDTNIANNGTEGFDKTIGSWNGVTYLPELNGTFLLWSKGSGSEHVKMVLLTGGKSKLRNLYRLSATATDDTTWQPVPSQEITIAGQSLDANGVTYQIFSDGEAPDVTPQVNSPLYSFSGPDATKYCSYFDVYVIKGNPPGDEGHAWWGLRTDAPQDALVKFFNSTELFYLSQQTYGYYPTIHTFPGYLDCPGELWVPESYTTASADVRRHFYIGFNGLQSAIDYAIGLHNSPGYYVVLGNNCVSQVRADARAAGGTAVPLDMTPMAFGLALQAMYWDESTTYSTLILP